MHSRYFQKSKSSSCQKQAKSVSRTAHSATELFCNPPPVESRFFRRQPNLDALSACPAFNLFYEECIAAMIELYHAKPILIQEHVCSDSWRVLVAVSLLNKTPGYKAIPVFLQIIDRWPTPAALAEAPRLLLLELLRHLGFGNMRSQRLIDISTTFLSDPPLPHKVRPSRGKTTALRLHPSGSTTVVHVDYPPTAVSHIPGCGPYALDSYRIFCSHPDAWKSVRPTDKELIKYLQWRWAIDEYRRWDPLLGPGDSIDLDYVRQLTSLLSTTSDFILH